MSDTQGTKTVTWRSLVVLLIVTLGLAGLSAFLTRNSMNVYTELSLPAYAPPGWFFRANRSQAVYSPSECARLCIWERRQELRLIQVSVAIFFGTTLL